MIDLRMHNIFLDELNCLANMFSIANFFQILYFFQILFAQPTKKILTDKAYFFSNLDKLFFIGGWRDNLQCVFSSIIPVKWSQ